jgi:hypothetical protein
LPAIRLGDIDSLHRLRSIPLTPEVFRQFSKPSIHPIRFDVLEPLTIHSFRAAIRAARGIGVRQHVSSVHLVIQRVEPKAGSFLRFHL